MLCLIGAVLLFVELPLTIQRELEIGRGVFQVVGFVLLAIGLFEFVLIYALADGSRVARIIVTVLVGLSLLGALSRALVGAGGLVEVIQSESRSRSSWGCGGRRMRASTSRSRSRRALACHQAEPLRGLGCPGVHPPDLRGSVEPETGIEPVTSSLPWRHSAD